MKLGFVVVALFSACVITACADSGSAKTPESAEVPESQELQPAEGESSWAKTEVAGVRISVPSEWEKSGPIKPDKGGQIFTFQTEENSFGTRGGAQLAVIDPYKYKASDLVDTTEDTAVAVVGAKDVSEKNIQWPGAEDAWLVTYVAYPPSNGEVAPHPTQVLVLDLPGGAQAQATVTALEEDFAPQKMNAVLRTVTITDNASTKEP